MWKMLVFFSVDNCIRRYNDKLSKTLLSLEAHVFVHAHPIASGGDLQTENFGMELDNQLFTSVVCSLRHYLVATDYSLSGPLWHLGPWHFPSIKYLMTRTAPNAHIVKSRCWTADVETPQRCKKEQDLTVFNDKKNMSLQQSVDFVPVTYSKNIFVLHVTVNTTRW